jgi:GTP-binding protein
MSSNTVTPVLAIVGRPNVGKSTLFNRLVGFKKAVVHNRPGVTRDRLYEQTELQGRDVLVVDTGGFEPRTDSDLLSAMRTQTLIAIEEASVIILVLDAQSGKTTADDEVADILRCCKTPVVVAINKVDGPRHEDLVSDFWTLGFDQLFPISAEHGRGIFEVVDSALSHLPEAPPDSGDEEEEENEDAPIKLAVIGRPNIGKSTLINQLLGESRHIVDDQPGTTMDPVDSSLMVGEREMILVDTAGVRRRSRIGDRLERFVSLRAIRAIERCHITLLMIDGTIGLTDQDARLAQLVMERGRGLILLVNKWDLVKGLEEMDSKVIDDQIYVKMPHASWAPYLFISAKTGKGLTRLFPIVENVFKEMNRRVPTPQLNRFLAKALTDHTPPQRYHHPVRIYYMAQTRVRPPTFVFFSNSPDGIRAAYRRYLSNQLRETYGFEGTPLRLHFKARRKTTENSS